MATVTQLMTADELICLPDDGYRYELVDGEQRRMSPAGNVHGRIAANLATLLFPFIRQEALGATFAAETGFLLSRDPDTVRAPDAAFISQSRLDEVGAVEGFWPGAPDLAAEVVSPSDSWSEVAGKAFAWLAGGAILVWVIDPARQNVTVYRNADDIRVLDRQAVLDAPELFPGWQIQVSELFE